MTSTCFRTAALKRVVSANATTLLFDIVNVQNWPAAPRLASIAVVPVARSLSFLRSAAADHFSILPAWLNLVERRPRNAEHACSTHAAGTIRISSACASMFRLRVTQNSARTPFRPHSSAGQSTRLVSGRSQVRLRGAGSIFFAWMSGDNLRANSPNGRRRLSQKEDSAGSNPAWRTSSHPSGPGLSRPSMSSLPFMQENKRRGCPAQGRA